MGDDNKWKAIESEMDRFEAEISSLTRQPNFIPAQIKRPTVSITAPPVIVSAPPMIRKPAPVVISGAPQRYLGPEASLRKPAPPTTSIRMGSSMIPSSLQPTHIRPAVASAPTPAALPAAAGSMNSSPVTVVAGSSSALPVSVSGATETSKASTSNADKTVVKKKKKKKKDDGKAKKLLRSAGGQIWEDTTLTDWDPSDFRLFCGDLGNDVTDEVLTRVFGRYPSFQKAKVVRDKRTNKTKGYGFVSFKDPNDFVRAIRELDGRYVGSRPIKLRKSNWRNRDLDQARKRDRERSQLLGIKKPLTKPR